RGQKRAGAHPSMAVPLEVLQKLFANFVAGHKMQKFSTREAAREAPVICGIGSSRSSLISMARTRSTKSHQASRNTRFFRAVSFDFVDRAFVLAQESSI